MMGVLTSTIVYRMQRLVEMSGNDGLTGLPNRAWLLQGMPRMFETIRNDGGSLTLALLDLDRFKRINDEIGHRDGDRAIRHFVAAVNETLQERERLVRIGGQEFVVLMHCPIGSAWERLDRLRRAMGDRPFLPELGGDPQVHHLQRRTRVLSAGWRRRLRPAAQRRPPPAAGQARRPQPRGGARYLSTALAALH